MGWWFEGCVLPCHGWWVGGLKAVYYPVLNGWWVGGLKAVYYPVTVGGLVV